MTEWFRSVEERRPDKTINQTARHNEMIQNKRRIVWIAFYNENPYFKLDKWASVVNIKTNKAEKLDREFRQQMGLKKRKLRIGLPGGGSTTFQRGESAATRRIAKLIRGEKQ